MSRLAVLKDLKQVSIQFRELGFKLSFLGAGASRAVFNIEGHPEWVLKVLRDKGDNGNRSSSCNAIEYYSWKYRVELREYFTEVVDVSTDGPMTYLIMKKADKWNERDRQEEFRKMREELPEKYRHDCRSTNLGVINGKLMMVDYGFLDILRHIPEITAADIRM